MDCERIYLQRQGLEGHNNLVNYNEDFHPYSPQKDHGNDDKILTENGFL